MVRGRSASVMCAKNKVNGEYSCDNRELLDRILRQDWGFPRLRDLRLRLVPQHARLHQRRHRVQELPQSKPFSGDALKAAIDAGDVTVATIDDGPCTDLHSDDPVRVFDRPRTTSPIDAAAGGAPCPSRHRPARRRPAQERPGTLPLDRDPAPLDRRRRPGRGAPRTPAGRGSSRVLPLYKVDPLDGIRNRARARRRDRYAPGVDSLSAAVLLPGPPASHHFAAPAGGPTAIGGCAVEYWADAGVRGRAAAHDRSPARDQPGLLNFGLRRELAEAADRRHLSVRCRYAGTAAHHPRRRASSTVLRPGPPALRSTAGGGRIPPGGAHEPPRRTSPKATARAGAGP